VVDLTRTADRGVCLRSRKLQAKAEEEENPKTRSGMKLVLNDPSCPLLFLNRP
jgi:hypothetical protein